MYLVCFITAIYGKYEVQAATPIECQPFVDQTLPTDFICFTDKKDIIRNGWKIDTNAYHGSDLDLQKISKFYKMCWHMIPVLKYYDVVIWIDSNMEIISRYTSEIIINKIHKNKILCWYHPLRNGQLRYDAWISSRMQKYSGQDIMKQYQKYVDNGYDDMYFKYLFKLNGYTGSTEHFGVWLTNFIAFVTKDKEVIEFLKYWYDEILKHTTQDRISFSYTCFKSNLVPYTLPDKDIFGIAHMSTQLYMIHDT